MQNKGELSVSEDPSHDELLTAMAGQDMECPEGHVRAGGQCVPVEEVRDVPPSIFNSGMQLSLESVETEPIEREELNENEVVYRNVKILQAGTWTDSNSRETIWYSPRGLSNMELTGDNVVNIMHDADNEVSAVGEMRNLRSEGDSLYADIVIDTESNAGGYADENMMQTLESEGATGFGGPSVEIPPDGQEIEVNAERGMKELTKGKISGLGLVMNPASKPVSFARQTAERGVALSDGEQTTMYLEGDRSLMDMENIRETLEEHGVDTENMDDEELKGMAETLYEELMGDMEGEDMGDYEGDEEEDEEMDMEDDEDMEDEDEDGMDMESKIQSLEERLQNVEDMTESMMAQEDLEEAREELADDETVQELRDAKEDIEKRLEALEQEPEEPKSLADPSEEDANRGDRNVTLPARQDRASNSFGR
jgi:hypothetical protein